MSERPAAGAPEGVRIEPTLASSEVLAPGAAAHYLRARELRADRYLDLARSIRNTRVLNAVLVATNLALAAAAVVFAGRQEVVPYVVEVDRTGAAVAVAPAERAAAPSEEALRYTLGLYFQNLRTVTVDQQLQERLILEVYDRARGRAVALLNDWYRRNSPFARAERTTVSPQVHSILALGEDRSTWQVQWTEDHRDLSGLRVRRETWQATARLVTDPPDRPEEVASNPFGIHVTHFDWTRIDTEDFR